MATPVSSNIEDLARKLGLDSRELLERALTHPGNRNLAWVGDTVLNLSVTEHIFKRNPDASRGAMTDERKSIVKNENLRQTAGEQLYREGHIRVPSSERDPRARRILATAFEAVTGLIFLEEGYEQAADYVRRNLSLKQDPGTKQEPLRQ